MLWYFLQQLKWNRKDGSKWSMLAYYPRWRAALRSGTTTIQDRLPWLSFPAIDLLQRSLKITDKVFEFGGGGSTLFFMDRVAEVVTVEHDGAWFEILKEHLEAEKDATWTGVHIPPEDGDLVPSPDPAEPLHYASLDEASKGKNFKAYATRIEEHPDGYFDVISIDGRSRSSCLYHAVPKLRSGGLLILDNAERSHYTLGNAKALSELEVVLNGMAPCLHNRDLSETRIYRKR